MANNVQTWGFRGYANVLADQITTLDSRVLNTAINESLAEYERQRTASLAMFCSMTTMHMERYLTVSGGTSQPLDLEGFASPLPTQETGYQDVAYPLQGKGDAFGYNRVSRAEATIGDVDRQIAAITRKDSDWLRRHLLAALFDNVSWSFTDPKYGAQTIKPLANTDGSTYIRTGGAAPTDDEHYLSSSGSGTEADLTTIYDELAEHPTNGVAPIVVFVPTANVAYMTSTTNNPNFVAATIPGIQNASTVAVFTANQSVYKGPGDLVLGQDGHCVLVEWKTLPTDYLIGLALNTDPPLAMREKVPAQLRGLFREDDSVDGNLNVTRLIRYCGFGARNRIAACVMKLGAQSYSIPTGYDAPLSV